MNAQTITSAAAFFKAANGRRVTRTAHNMATSENWPERAADIRAQLLAQGCPEERVKEDDSGIHWGSGFVLKPKHAKTVTGAWVTRSNDYTFLPDGQTEKVYGEKKGATIQGGALRKETHGGGFYTYAIEDGARA